MAEEKRVATESQASETNQSPSHHEPIQQDPRPDTGPSKHQHQYPQRDPRLHPPASPPVPDRTLHRRRTTPRHPTGQTDVGTLKADRVPPLAGEDPQQRDGHAADEDGHDGGEELARRPAFHELDGDALVVVVVVVVVRVGRGGAVLGQGGDPFDPLVAALAEAGFPEEAQQARFGQVVLVLGVVVVPEVHRPRAFRDEFGRGVVGQEVHAPHRPRAGESAEGATHAVVF